MSDDRAEKPSVARQPRLEPRGRMDESAGPGSGARGWPVDPWRLVEVIKRRAVWLFLGAMVIGGSLLLVLPKQPRHVAAVHFLHSEDSMNLSFEGAAAPARSRGGLPDTFAGFLRSPELMRRVSGKAKPPIRPADLGANVEVLRAETAALLSVRIKGTGTKEDLAALANLYAEEFCLLTRELRAREAMTVNQYLKEALESVDREIVQANQELVAFLREAKLFNYDKETDAFLQQRNQLDRDYSDASAELESTELKIKSLWHEILLLKRGEIEQLLTTLTEAHPQVQDRYAELAALEKQLQQDKPDSTSGIDIAGPVGNSLFVKVIDLRVQKISLQRRLEELKSLRETVNQTLAGLAEKTADYTKIQNRLQSLRMTQTALAGRQREAEFAEKSAPGEYRPLRTVTVADVGTISGWFKPVIFAGAAAAVFFLGAVGLLLLVEIADDRIKTVADLKRATDLALLATLGDLKSLSPAAQSEWAFRTWTILASKLSGRNVNRVVCGFVSAQPGEGRTTWLERLAAVANTRGWAVAIVSAGRPPASQAEVAAPPRRSGSDPLMESAGDWLELVTRHLTEPVSKILTICPPPDWTWNVKQVESWRAMIRRCDGIDRAALLVELPPAREPEAGLLAEALPQVIWLTLSGRPRISETRLHLETLRCAGCNLVGTVLNRAPRAPLKVDLPGWLRRLTFVVALVAIPSWAQETNLLAEPTPGSELSGSNRFFSVFSPRQRAPWQERLTLGPGDGLNITLYGLAESARNDITVGPDGRLSYLQAQDIMAAGLTIDELRAVLEEQLATHFRRPRVIITPIAFRSKKYCLLGAVAQRGVFTLDRPLTLIEAVARAGGLASENKTGRSVVELADLSRSFLVRNGKKTPINLEALFFEGDLSQNVPLEPNDYLYFAPAALNEVYVFGAVGSPGILAFTPQTTLIGAITDRGGFTADAYQRKVLVIRGSLARPETYVVSATDIRKGKAPDFRLQRKDIVYVSKNPWNMVGQILDLAIRSYMYGVVITWTGETVTPWIDTKPYISTPD